MDKIEKDIRKKYSEKWSWVNKSDEDLKNLAKDLYNGLIFTDRSCSGSLLQSVFMPLLFMHPSNSSSDKREDAIYKVLEHDIEMEFYNIYIENIGMVYEYLSKSCPMSVNGMPIFYSICLLSKDQTDRMLKFFNEYKSMREIIDNF